MLMVKIGIQHGLPVRQSHSSAHRRSDAVRQRGGEDNLLLRLFFLARNLCICLFSTYLLRGVIELTLSRQSSARASLIFRQEVTASLRVGRCRRNSGSTGPRRFLLPP